LDQLPGRQVHCILSKLASILVKFYGLNPEEHCLHEEAAVHEEGHECEALHVVDEIQKYLLDRLTAKNHNHYVYPQEEFQGEPYNINSLKVVEVVK